MMKTDIKENTSEISFLDNVIINTLKTESSHATNNYGVFVDADTGVLYAAEAESGSGSSETSLESLAPYNQSMEALVTSGNGSLATSVLVQKTPIGRVDVLINGLSIDVGSGKSCYFSDDNGVTAKARGSVTIGDKLFWNGSIATYELEIDDRIDFDYLITGEGVANPVLDLNISGGNWGVDVPANYILDPGDYIEPPFEEWHYEQDTDNFIRLTVSETATDLLNVAQVKINGILETYVYSIPLLGVIEDDKKIVDQLFKTYTSGGVSLTLARGANWASFTL